MTEQEMNKSVSYIKEAALTLIEICKPDSSQQRLECVLTAVRIWEVTSLTSLGATSGGMSSLFGNLGRPGKG